MKRVIFFLFLSLIGFQGFSQKFGYIDTEYIMSKMPEYQEAQKMMNQYSDQWIKDIQLKYEEIDKIKTDYRNEEILLTADMKKERLKAISDKEEAVKKLNNDIFGLNGQLFQKKKEILKPVMEAIYLAAEKVAKQRKLMFLFDKASDLSMIYTDPRHDYTDYILEELGILTKK